MATPVIISIKAVTEGVQTAFRQVTGLVQEQAGAVKTLNSQLSNGAAAATQMMSGLAALFGIQQIRGMVADSIEADQAMARLDNALQRQGTANAAYRQELAATREELRRKVGADDDVTVPSRWRRRG